METIYDKIGIGYSVGRREDPIIASKLQRFFVGAESLLNIGAGTGSYESISTNVVAIEPSQEMIKQRPIHSAPVKLGSAESLPFDDGAFTHSMTVLSMHHWIDRAAAFNEIKRVTKKRFVAVTWNPASEPYWLTRDYFPEIHTIDQTIFPSIDELEHHFSGVKYFPLEIPKNCIDGFTAAFWARPHAYLDPPVRSCMSTFSKISELECGLRMLNADLESGAWEKKYNHLKACKELDVGYIIAVCDVQSNA